MSATPRPTVLMYATGLCPFCIMARRLLQHKGVAFDEIRVDLLPEQRAHMRARAAGAYTVPQIFIGERHVGGWEQLSSLERSGQLDALLQGDAQ